MPGIIETTAQRRTAANAFLLDDLIRARKDEIRNGKP